MRWVGEAFSRLGVESFSRIFCDLTIMRFNVAKQLVTSDKQQATKKEARASFF